MKNNYTQGIRLAAAVGCLSGLALAFVSCDSGKAAVIDPSAKLAHGRYLVEQVGMCTDCHSPRGADGAFDQSRWLQGAPLGFTPAVPMPAWAPFAPALVGLHNYTDKQALALLTEGRTSHGQTLRPPMPPYRFNHEDAEAVIAYLRSLK